MVAEGYKDTEIGVIPVEWDVVKLKDIVKKLQSGGTPLSTNSAFYGGNIPFVKIDDITRSGKYLTKTKVSITESGLDSSSAWLVPTNSILYSMYASIGFLSINKIEVSTNQAIMNIIPDYSKITLEFLYQYLLDLKGKIDKFIDQTTQKNLNAQKIKNFNIPLPPLKEQEKIADILSTADDKIDAITSQIEKAETLKKGLLQKLLSEGIGHSEFKDSELGKIPESWDVVQVKDTNLSIIDGDRGSNYPKSDEFTDSGFCLFLSAKNITKNGFRLDEKQFISEEKDNLLRKGKLKNLDIIITTRGSVGHIAFNENIQYANMRINSGMVILRNDKNTINQRYLYKLFGSNVIQRQIETIAFGSAQPQLTVKGINNLKFPLPPLEEQKQIADILSTADEKLEVLKAKKEKCETLKKGLLQKLLSGEVRV